MFAYGYTFVATLLYLLSLPFVGALSLRKKYQKSLPARFFLYHNPPFKKNLIHFHVCSFGEARAIEPLVKHFDEVNISVITQTGFHEAQKLSKEVRYLPFEPLLWLWLRPQKALVVFEAELWYLLFLISKRRGAKTFLVNARMSDRSFPRYKKFRWLYKKIFENIDRVYAQSEIDKERLLELGAKNVEVMGNLKLLQKPQVTKKMEKKSFVIVAASTHDPEEEIIVTAWVEAGKRGTLVVVPRHPERFEEVDELLEHVAKREQLRYHRLSQREDLTSDIVLVDCMGELINIYAQSDLVLLGGSFIDGIGGHNPIEPAFFEKPIISGPFYYNQKATYAAVEGIEVIDPDSLKNALNKEHKKTKIVDQVNITPLVRELENVVQKRG